MVRTQVVLEQSQQIALRELARERGVSVSEVIRTMIDREVARRQADQVRLAATALRDSYVSNSDLTAFGVIEHEGLDDER
ncbi:MAG: ribbon-helix-helix protein, CopG family [Spirochaetaceae bacterium]|nr:MAG: ribbon-helix-helix protein, CopG family [Spirochaetaceae bacterium]